MKSLESKRIGKITTQQAIKKNQVNKVYFIENPSEIYLFESFTWIPIHIVYLSEDHFTRPHELMMIPDAHTELGLPVLA